MTTRKTAIVPVLVYIDLDDVDIDNEDQEVADEEMARAYGMVDVAIERMLEGIGRKNISNLSVVPYPSEEATNMMDNYEMTFVDTDDIVK